MKTETVTIRKYGNRRLYDTSSSRYVNLEDIAGLIRKGADVKVVDARSGEDLTRAVPTQIITEDVKGQPSGLPLELLKQIILASDHARQEFLAWYLRTTFETYHKVQESFQSRLTDVGSAAFAPLQRIGGMIASALAPQEGQPSGEVEQLRRRVAELEAELRSRPTPKPARKSPGKRPRAQ